LAYKQNKSNYCIFALQRDGLTAGFALNLSPKPVDVDV